jgi:hypothetical protein
MPQILQKGGISCLIPEPHLSQKLSYSFPEKGILKPQTAQARGKIMSMQLFTIRENTIFTSNLLYFRFSISHYPMLSYVENFGIRTSKCFNREVYLAIPTIFPYARLDPLQLRGNVA